MKSLPSLTAAAAAICGVLAIGALGGIGSALLAQNSEEPQSDAKSREEVPEDPRAVLEQAREKLIGLKSVRAKMVETIAIGSRRYKATGAYLQGTDLKLRLEYAIKSGTTEGSLLEVCDGTILWSSQKIGDVTKLTRRDVRQILSAAAGGGNVAENILIAELGLGGVPALLASLERSMTFDRAQRQEIDGAEFVIVEGTWNAEYRQRLQGGPGSTSAQRLPELVPDRVRIYFDAETLFPRRIQYLKERTESALERAMVTLDFTDVVLDGAVSETDFRFEPPEGVYAEDVTNKFIQKLKPAAAAPAESASAAKPSTSPAGK